MPNKRSLKLTTRLLLLFVLGLTALVLSAPQQRVVKADVYTCIQYMEFCYYDCAVQYQGNSQEYNECAAQCELNRNGCETCTQYQLPPDCEGGYDDLPQPWPVVDNYNQCMDNCANCLWLPSPERSECWSPCKASCIALYLN